MLSWKLKTSCFERIQGHFNGHAILFTYTGTARVQVALMEEVHGVLFAQGHTFFLRSFFLLTLSRTLFVPDKTNYALASDVRSDHCYGETTSESPALALAC